MPRGYRSRIFTPMTDAEIADLRLRLERESNADWLRLWMRQILNELEYQRATVRSLSVALRKEI